MSQIKIAKSVSKHKGYPWLVKAAKEGVYIICWLIEGIMLLVEFMGAIIGSLFHCRHKICDQWGRSYSFPYILDRFLQWQANVISPFRKWSQH